MTFGRVGSRHRARGTKLIWGCLALVTSLGVPPAARAQAVLTVAAYPSVDVIVEAAIPAWAKRHPNVAIKVVSRQFADHHTAMTTALSTSFYLPDVMALEVGYVGRFAQGGGLEDLGKPPYDIGRMAGQYVPYALAQATSRAGAIVAAPTDIGPGTLLWRADVLGRAGVSEAELTESWDAHMEEDLLVVDRVSRRLMLRSGSAVVGVWNEAFDLDGVPPDGGTTVPGVQRVLKAEARSSLAEQRSGASQ